MTSLCKPVNQAQPLQELMIECLVYYPNTQHQESNQTAESFKPESVYWTDEPSITKPFSSLPRYHTALVFGATAVCSAGAIMQHAEIGFWAQSAVSSSDNTVQLKQTTSDADVVTPPITEPQINALFSSVPAAVDADELAETCQENTCDGLAFIEQRLPELQEHVETLKTEMARFQQQYTAQTLETHRSILAHRNAAVVRKRADLEVRSQELTQQVASLTSALSLQPEEARQITNLLDTNATYQIALYQLKALEHSIAVQYSDLSDLNSNTAQLDALYTEYVQIADQLRQTAQIVLEDSSAAISAEFSNAMWQEDNYLALLQELMDLAHLQQMLAVEQNTLTKIDEHLTHRHQELAVLLRQYAVMQRQLDGQNRILQQYMAKRQELQNNPTSTSSTSRI